MFADLFRRHDTSGFAKFAWCVFVIVIPLLGVLVYLISQGKHMAQRDVEQSKAAKAQFDEYVRETAGGAGAEIAHAKELLDAGTISQEEFDKIKQKALA